MYIIYDGMRHPLFQSSQEDYFESACVTSQTRAFGGPRLDERYVA